MQTNIKDLHVQRNFWKPHGRTSLCCRFYCVKDDANEDLENSQIMHYILCDKKSN